MPRKRPRPWSPSGSTVAGDLLNSDLSDGEVKAESAQLQNGMALHEDRRLEHRVDERLGKTGLRKQWRKLEELAGVEHMEWRNWYGVRRKQSDLAEDVETDARVLNRLGAWTQTATREHYQEQGRPEILEKVARTRRKIRPRRSDGGTP